jgi:hypothetical protein
MPNAPFLAPERDSAFKLGRAKAGGTPRYTLPGFLSASTSTVVLNADQDRYCPAFVQSSVVIDQLAIEVTTNTASTVRVGVYAADTDLQPVGAPIIDSGTIDCSTTGVKTYTPGTPVLLPRGRYLSVLNSSATPPTLRMWRGHLLGMPSLLSVLGASPYGELWAVTRTYAAFPTPGTAWTADNGVSGTTGVASVVVWRVSQP